MWDKEKIADPSSMQDARLTKKTIFFYFFTKLKTYLSLISIHFSPFLLKSYAKVYFW